MRALPVSIKQRDIEEFARKWGVRELSLFGSILREDFGPGSDVDVLVTFNEGLRDFLPPRQGMRHLYSALARLEKLTAGGRTDLETALQAVSQRLRRRGIVVFITDGHPSVAASGRHCSAWG